MNKCKILIADDEKLAREAIKLHLPVNDNILIVAECADGNDALQQIAKHQPDILFLDIKMPALSGFEVLQSLPVDYNPYVIMATAYDNFALTAYEHNAVDYLLKPFTADRFLKAFNKAYTYWQARDLHVHLSEIQSFSKKIQSLLLPEEQTSNILKVRDGAKVHFVSFNNIIYIEASKDYAAVHTKDRKYLHKETMQILEAILPSKLFVRIHKSCIVNINYIKQLESHYNGDYTVLLTDGKNLRLSRNYRDNLLKTLH